MNKRNEIRATRLNCKIVGQVAYVHIGACRPLIQRLVKEGYQIVFVKEVPSE